MTTRTAAMTKEFSLPDLGEGVKEGQVLRLLVAEGDRVAEDQLLMEVETDKAAVEIPSPYSGVIERWHVAEQQVVNVGDLMVTFSDDGAAARATPVPTSRAGTPPTPAAAAASPAAPAPTAPTAAPTRATTSRKPASPAVRKLARSLGVDLETVSGTGPGGRVLRGDVEAAAAAPSAVAPAGTTSTAPAARHAPRNVSPVPAAVVSEPPGRDDSDAVGPTRREAISTTRKAIAAAMAYSATHIPHVTDSDDADVTDLDRLRRGYNETAPPEAKVGLLAFVIRAVVRALQGHPIFNASFDETAEEIVYKRYFNIAVGVQTERGLVAPVLRNVETMSIPQIDRALTALVDKAHRGTFALEDTRGATYTISNAGAMGGSRYSTPIITHPQVAVLAVGKSVRRPWVLDGTIVPRLIMPLSHSMDHRIIDGAREIAFMRQVIGDLENPARLML